MKPRLSIFPLTAALVLAAIIAILSASGLSASPFNTPPVAGDAHFQTDESVPLSIVAPGLLAYASDPDNNGTMSLDGYTYPANGQLVVSLVDGAFDYTPNPGFTGIDTFTYTVSDGFDVSVPATVTIEVLPIFINNAPVPTTDAYGTHEGIALEVGAPGVLGNDSDPDFDPLTASVAQFPVNGTLDYFDPDGSFKYTPSAGFVGTDEFYYNVSDGTTSMDWVYVSITVEPAEVPTDPEPTPEPGWVEVVKRGCPVGYDAVNATIDALRADCTDPMAGTSFIVSDVYKNITKQTVDQGGSSAQFWDGIAPGSVVIEEQVPAGYADPYWQCTLNGQVLVSGHGPVATYDQFQDSDVLSCEFFNFPYTDDEDSGRIEVIKWVCPVGYDMAAAALDELTQNCGGPAGGFEFTLYTGGQTFTSGTTGPIADPWGPAHVIFDNVPASDDVDLVETIPSGYGAPVVWCTSTYSGGALLQPTVDAGSISFKLEPGGEVICNWFNVPETEEEGRLLIVKRACPAGYDAEHAALDEAVQTCDTAANGVAFTAQVPGQTFTAESVPVAGDDTYSLVDFGLIPAGDVAVAEEELDGYEEPVVWCTNSSATDFVQLDLIDNSGVVYLPAGGDAFCQWFNIPTEGDAPGDNPGDKPGKTTPVITKLPDTGTGTSHRSATGATLPLAIVLGFGGLIAAEALRRSLVVIRTRR